jgi:hypothetical protein
MVNKSEEIKRRGWKEGLTDVSMERGIDATERE